MPMAISLSGSRSLITTSLTDDIANRSDAAAGWSYNGGEIIVHCWLKLPVHSDMIFPIKIFPVKKACIW
jgi:hypothetical protein